MSIVSVDNIQPIGSGTSITVNSAATLVLNNANSTGVVTATSFVGNLTGNPTGTLQTAAQPNITSVGTLSGLTVAGNVNCTSGRFQRGSATIQDGDAIAGGININGLDMDASVIMSVFGNDGDFTRISGSKSRNASVGSHTIVQNNDVLLSLKGFGSDGTNFEEAAQIEMQVDGSPNNNVMPGRIVFKTATTDGVVERLRIDSSGRLLINTTAVTNTNDALTVKRAASGFTEMSMTVDANTATGTHANAFVFTKSKNTYWNGLGFQSSHGHIGAIVGMRDSTAMNTSQKIRIELGGTGINASEEKTWEFQNDGDLSISDGNLVVASGHGIDFSSASGSNAGSSSAVLDDYEEGSFTAILRSNSNPSNTGYSYDASNNFTSYYTKIGNIVYVQIQLSNLHTSPDLRNHQLIRVEGLPFAAARRSGLAVIDGRGIYPRWSTDQQTTNAATWTPWIDGSSTMVYLQFYMHYTPYTAWATVANSTSSQRLHLAGCYPVS